MSPQRQLPPLRGRLPPVRLWLPPCGGGKENCPACARKRAAARAAPSACEVCGGTGRISGCKAPAPTPRRVYGCLCGGTGRISASTLSNSHACPKCVEVPREMREASNRELLRAAGNAGIPTAQRPVPISERELPSGYWGASQRRQNEMVRAATGRIPRGASSLSMQAMLLDGAKAAGMSMPVRVGRDTAPVL
eukprot:gene10469-19649_t